MAAIVSDGWSRRLFLIVAAIAIPLLSAAIVRGDLFPQFQLHDQDLPVLVALLGALVVLAVRPIAIALPDRGLGWPTIFIGAATIAALLWAGTYAIMANYAISRDEHMVLFDMAVFGHGRLAEPLAPQWRDYAQVLVPAFLLDPTSPHALVSSYLPTNAMIRLAFSHVADPALMNPVLAALGGIALFDIARRLFGEDRRAIVVAMIVYVTSAQMLVTTMTVYAMTPHMALNLIWLAAFLRGGWRGHVVAIAVGFVAIGLHQLAFHPMFAAPFVAWRLAKGEWKLATVYGVAYLAMLGFWTNYAAFVSLQVTGGPIGAGPEDDFWADRVRPLLLERDPLTLPLMILNLLRFTAWQNLALVPLVAAAVPLALRNRGAVAPLVGGIAIALALFTLILPFQGHGWGYRYLHGFLGSFALLAGYGYRELADRFDRRADGMVVALTAVTLVFAIPFLMWRAHGFVAQHVALERLIAARTSDMVLVDTDPTMRTLDGRWTPNAIDQVRNLPDLSNRPIRLSSRMLGPQALARLCERGSISVVSRADQHRIGFGMDAPIRSPEFERMVATIAGKPCLKP